jgi:predicted nucleotide-binding protein
LYEQANQSRTVIEKIEAHSDVGFAVVLLTPDDEGSLKGENRSLAPARTCCLSLDTSSRS